MRRRRARGCWAGVPGAALLRRVRQACEQHVHQILVLRGGVDRKEDPTLIGLASPPLPPPPPPLPTPLPTLPPLLPRPELRKCAQFFSLVFTFNCERNARCYCLLVFLRTDCESCTHHYYQPMHASPTHPLVRALSLRTIYHDICRRLFAQANFTFPQSLLLYARQWPRGRGRTLMASSS